MSTEVRDAIVAHFAKSPEKALTAEEIAEKLKLNAGSASATMGSLAKRAVLMRGKRGKGYEYSAGKRLEFGQKYAGRKFPFKHKEKANGEAIPASAGGVGIVVKLDGQAHAITLADAKGLYLELKVLFG